MKKYFYFLCFFVGLNSCNLSEECIADIAVTALELPAPIITGNVLSIVCTIKNVVQTTIECTSSDPGTATITCGYSSTPQDNISSYEIFDERVVSLNDDVYAKGQQDLMEMTIQNGPGHYVMKVEVDSPLDNESGNDSREIRVKVN